MSSDGRSYREDPRDYYRPHDRVVERERRHVQDIPYEDLEEVRNRELAPFRAPYARAQLDRREGYDRAYNDDYYDSRQIATRDRLDPPARPSYDRRRDARSTDGRDRRRDYASSDRDRRRREDYSDASDSDSSRERHRRRRHRRARSEAPPQNYDAGEETTWNAMKNKKEGNFKERNFDKSYDGLIAGMVCARGKTNL